MTFCIHSEIYSGYILTSKSKKYSPRSRYHLFQSFRSQIGRTLIIDIFGIVALDFIAIHLVTTLSIAPINDFHRRKHTYILAISNQANGKFPTWEIFLHKHVFAIKAQIVLQKFPEFIWGFRYTGFGYAFV